MADDFNLFQILDLDPGVRWDDAVFEQRLKEKRNEWNKLFNHPTKATMAKRYIELIPRIKDVAANASRREEHAKAAQSAGKEDRERLLKMRDADLEVLESKGFLLESELADLAKKYAALGTERDLRAMVRVEIRKQGQRSQTADEGLAPSIARGIREKLDQLGMRDLYQFLSETSANQTTLDRSASVKELLDAAGRIYQMAATGKTDATSDLRSALAGECMNHFKDPASKARYDAALDNSRFEMLRERADLAAGKTKELSAAAVELLLRRFREEGGDKTSTDRALDVLREHAKKRNYSMEVAQGAVTRAASLPVCGYDGAVNRAGDKHCTTCGKPLEEPCPGCGAIRPTSQSACDACGFVLGKRRLVAQLCDEAENACAGHDFRLAEERQAQAAAEWPNSSRGELAGRINTLKQKIAEGIGAQREYLQELRQEIRGRRFFHAEQRLRSSARYFLDPAPELAADRQRVQEAIAAANQALRRASDLPDAQKVDAYSRVLEIAADCEPAQSALAAHPPEPPLNVRAQVDAGRVDLTWTAPPGLGLSYVILRRTHSPPGGIDPAERAAATPGTSWQDTAPPVGVPVHYAIATERGGVRSRSLAQVDSAIFVLQDVKDLKAEVGDSEVTLTWSPVPAGLQVIVRRDRNVPPRRPDSGVGVSVSPQGRSAVDRGLTNGQRYHYTVFSQLSLPGVREVHVTSGVHLFATPDAPPAPVKDLSVGAEGPYESRRIQLKWAHPPRGQVLVYAGDQSFNIKSGSRLSRAQLQALGTPLAAQETAAAEQLQGQRARHYLPVTVVNDTAVAGDEQIYRNLDECSDLSCQNLGRSLRLKWRWPSACKQVRIAHSPLKYLTEREAKLLTLEEYKLRGYIDIPNPTGVDQFIVVYAEYPMPDGSFTCGSGSRQHVRVASRMTVKYEIKKNWLGGKLTLLVKVDGAGVVPPMVLVSRTRTVPTTRAEGERILRVEVPPGTRELSLPIPKEVCLENTFGRLFMEDDSAYEIVTLQPPPHTALRLF